MTSMPRVTGVAAGLALLAGVVCAGAVPAAATAASCGAPAISNVAVSAPVDELGGRTPVQLSVTVTATVTQDCGLAGSPAPMLSLFDSRHQLLAWVTRTDQHGTATYTAAPAVGWNPSGTSAAVTFRPRIPSKLHLDNAQAGTWTSRIDAWRPGGSSTLTADTTASGPSFQVRHGWSVDGTPAWPVLVRYGRTATYTGRVEVADWSGGGMRAGRWPDTPRVVLYARRPGRETWTRVATVAASSTGLLRYAATAVHSVEYRWDHQVVPRLPVLVVHKNDARLVSTAVSPHPIAYGEHATVTGRLQVRSWDAPSLGWLPYPQRRVALQYRRSGTRTWTTVTDVRSTIRGYLAHPVTGRHSGYYRWVYGRVHGRAAFAGVYRPA